MNRDAHGQPLSRTFNAARLNDRKIDELKRETGADPFSVVKGQRRSYASRSQIRRILYIATLVATRWNSRIKAFY